jgi:hypothetical protein
LRKIKYSAIISWPIAVRLTLETVVTAPIHPFRA